MGSAQVQLLFAFLGVGDVNSESLDENFYKGDDVRDVFVILPSTKLVQCRGNC